MRNPFEALVEPLDPETQAMVDAVCGALDDPWGVTVGQLGPRFKYALYLAAKFGPPEIRQRIFEAVEAGVRSDPELFLGTSGYIYPREQVAANDGTYVYERGDDGEMRRVLKFPTGYFANGNPSYDRKEAA